MLALSLAEPPKFTVVNRCSQTFAVVNKVPATAVTTYQDVLARVRAGETLTVAVGVSEPANVWFDAVGKLAPGVYRFYPVGDQPYCEPVAKPPQFVPAVRNILNLPGSR